MLVYEGRDAGRVVTPSFPSLDLPVFFVSFIWKDEIVLHSEHSCFRHAVILYVSTFAGFHQRYTQGQAISEIQDGVHLYPEARLSQRDDLIFLRRNSVTRVINAKRK